MPLNPHQMKSATKLICNKARRLCRQRGFTTSDQEDIEQELWLHLVAQADKYDSTRDWGTFASFVLDKRCISLLRHRLADKRTPIREEYSLNETVNDSDGRSVDRHQVTSEVTTVTQRLRDLERDIAELRALLPSDELKMFMDGLVVGGSVNSVGGDLRMKRREAATQYRTICQYFEDAEMRDYL